MIKRIATIAGFALWLAAGVALLAWADDRTTAGKVGTDGTSGSMLQWIGAGVALSGLLGLLYVTGLFRALVGAAVAWRQSAPAAPAPVAPPAGANLDALAPPPAEPPPGPVGS